MPSSSWSASAREERRPPLPATSSSSRVLAEHYLAPAALLQKVDALAHRAETQARDVFDLSLLFTQLGPMRPATDEVSRSALPLAIDRAMGVSYDEYAGQVLAFLEDEHRVLYESREAWDQLQAGVVNRLEELAT